MLFRSSEVGGYSRTDYSKIVPYFQKAGRYSEVEAYATSVLIPAVQKDCSQVFIHKPKKIQSAFAHSGASEIFDKLRLCAKREGSLKDELRFQQLAESELEKYQLQLKLGEEEVLKKEYRENVDIFGVDTNEWPEALRNRFVGFINT